MAAAEPSPERAQRTTTRLLWTSAGLTVLVGVFLVSDVIRTADRYTALAWVGVALSTLAILSLTVLYAGCASGRLSLNQQAVGKLTLFQLSTLCLVIAVGADILIPARNTGGLALLLPWAITYWLHNLRPTERNTPA
ncbi:hypothetical protein EV644_103454 [Kribbella orskensis]|uniref:ATP synthase protein I n=1 Tax=Kribbella orskensis TaxID=2512216 RepID=A0ABY2BQ37_9ACTN|nr:MULTISPECIES: hypothetical protein [Kribbella]TCN37341.1 hypothetical protein EV642_112208 [Kribbella sp. VKM Ac-2500]TCO27751.1 hypothetical protein EV644_103454 [Kribbella orskensis]